MSALVWMIPLGWAFSSIVMLVGARRFLEVEDERIATLDRRSERARQRVERESRPPEEIERERAMWAAQARAMSDASNAFPQVSGLAWAQMNATQAQNMLGAYGQQQAMSQHNRYSAQFGFLGGLFG